jgi:uncharacterized protein YbjT (DUF2867 family)
MKYVLTGSLGNITKPLAEQLIAAGHDLTIISSKPERAAAIAQLGAKPAIGLVENSDFLAAAFKGADAVYVMVPPKWDAPDWKGYIAGVGSTFAMALKTAGIKKVVHLSSIGAHMPDGCGPVSGIHYVEEALNGLANTDVKHIRAGFFYLNLLSNIDMIRNAHFYGNNYGGDTLVPLTHPRDIAIVAAEELLSLSFTGKSVRYIISDERSSKEIASVLGAAIGQTDLPYVAFSDDDALNGMVQAGLSKEVARNYAEMGKAVRTGEMISDFNKNKIVSGKTKLEDFAKEFAAAYAKSPAPAHA